MVKIMKIFHTVDKKYLSNEINLKIDNPIFFKEIFSSPFF